jgi:hypothetical protein
MDQKFLDEKAVFRAWIGPTKRDLKVNIDSAFSPTSGPAAVGVIARTMQATRISWLGVCYFVAGMLKKRRLPLLSWRGSVLRKDRWPANTSVVVESDCSNLVANIMGKEIDRSVLSGLISDIQFAMSRRNSCPYC